MKQLILGGARSGKSRYAEQLAENSGADVIYIATSEARDEEMQQRIARHRLQRPQHWALVEEPLQLAKALQDHDAAGKCLLVDCLTLWLSNLLCHKNNELFAEQRALLLSTLPTLKSDIILVSNEVGHGIVPMGELNRRFVDESGWLHQDIARIAERVVWVVAGLPQILK
jgi:adenosylcobinamide kinase/adenosylcobinamide-phosphate guanylyltransferase